MPHHHRSRDEYVRPAEALQLDRYCTPDREVFAAGTWHHQDALVNTADGQDVHLELVPEPRNRWDHWAVALDLHGERVGYLQARSAKMWHDVVRAWNRDGHALYLAGQINRWSDEPGRAQTGVTLAGVSWPDLAALACAAGLRDDFDALCARLTPDQLTGLAEDRGYTPAKATLRALRGLRDEFDQFTWQRADDNLTLAERAPFWIGYFVRDDLQQQATYDGLIARVRRLAKHRIKALERAKREAERTAYLQHGPRAVELHQSGMSKRAIATELGIADHQVRKLLADEQPQNAAASTWHAAAQQERIADARRALDLQRTGMARGQIAVEMERSQQSIKELLSDAKFYENPSQYPGRHQLARRAVDLRAEGFAKAEVLARLNTSGLAGTRAFRDASVLEVLAGG